MKVILNKDLNPLGEEGDIKEVAKGYARNYLFPRGIALPYTEKTVKLFESRHEEIEARKAAKRQDALSVKERLEALDLVISMPAGANGKLYGAVTGQTVAEELSRQGFPVERKKVELPGNTFKSVGKYKVTVKLYESAAAEIGVTVQAQIIKTETREPTRRDRRRHIIPGAVETAAAETGDTAVTESTPMEGANVEGAAVESAAPDTTSAAPVTTSESTPPAETAEQN